MPIFWNDFEILQLIDACDRGERGGIHSGIALAQTLAADRGVPFGHGYDASLIRELFVLREAGLVTWQVLSSHGRVQPITPNDPNDYLNNIREFALTTAGRDRARGQIIRVPMPDEDEDDGRMIRALTLEDIANVIGEAYSPLQVLQLLGDSGVSIDDFSFENVSVEGPSMVGHVLYELSGGTSGQRRELRHFLGAWLEDQLHTGPTDEERERIERDLTRQGWFVKEGRLVIGEPVRRTRNDAPPMAVADQLHPIVWNAAAPKWSPHHLHDAVLASAKAVNAMLQAKVGRFDLAEATLVQAAFSKNLPAPGQPRLRFPAIDDDKTRDSQTAGALSFGVGCFQAIRNPVGHLPDERHVLTEQDALERLAALSLLARWIEEATLTTADD